VQIRNLKSKIGDLQFESASGTGNETTGQKPLRRENGVSAKNAEARAWAMVNELSGGGKPSVPGRKKDRR